MKKIFSLDGGVYQFLNTVYNLLIINVLTVIFSLPIVTMGSAVSAGYHLIFKLDKSNPTMKEFLNSFKANLFTGSLLALVYAALGAFLVGVISLTLDSPIQFLLLLVLSFFIIVVMNTFLTVAYFNLALFKNIQFAVFLTLKYTGFFCISLSSIVISLLIPIFLPKLMFIWFFFGVSVPMMIQVKIYEYCINRFQMTVEEGELN
ncbi:MAG: DUF624 domain-containing protein [Ruoffia tabacinasalis]|uniref:DUF624 domain-containing protein n=1 Tax=Ruoffia tabacinasalis TaxID=87458 RepID=A0A5R9EN02_9LACT|nr:DUF624 domain-containing protein [Ruoffia tabacinasalis]TLQ48945.1 DUF624 domain-containing protein [Ruoffia tabacinasalis]HBY89988.1 hypothetical protein [Aerococcaceae bacterium]